MNETGYFILTSAVVFLLSYICGSLPSGYLIGKFNGIDIRHYGSHNIGATNVRRVLGKDWSTLCFLLDFFKGMLPVIFIGHSLASHWTCGAGWGGIFAATGAVCGHIFPVWLNFKGGKGVATSLGCAIALAFLPVLCAGIFWLIFFYRTRIVAIASIAAVAVLAISSLILHYVNHSIPWPVVILFIIIAITVIVCHNENIARLLQGQENAFRKK